MYQVEVTRGCLDGKRAPLQKNVLIVIRGIDYKTGEAMIEINHRLLSHTAIENLILEVITRDDTDYGEHEITIQTKKDQLMRQLDNDLAVIVFSVEENICDIIKAEDFQKYQSLNYNRDTR